MFDDGVSLGPLTDMRASFAVRTGALTTLERLTRIIKNETGVVTKGVWATAALERLTREAHGMLPVNDRRLIERAKDVLLVNGRCAGPAVGLKRLKVGEAIVAGETVIAARLGPDAARGFLESVTLPGDIVRLSADASACGLLEQPWDVIRHRDALLKFDLDALAKGRRVKLPAGVSAINPRWVHAGRGAMISRGVVLDAEKGRIAIGAAAVIRPGAVIVGPASIGEGSTVLERTLIKGGTAIGPVCKVAGEIGGTIVQGFSNKAHDGHLGDSWVGEWANFGAGTTNSNLLNTYGEVVAQTAPDARRMHTGLTFLGCIVGDHVKFAIMTRIMTGAVFGTGSMIAQSTAPTCVGRFEWVTDERRQAYRWERFAEVAAAVFARRKMTMSEAYVERLRGLSSGA